jgi:hypothetical protein
MPQPGDRHPGFIVEHTKCWAMVYDGISRPITV